MGFGRKLVVLHTRPSMFYKLLVHAGDGVELWTRISVYRFMKGEIHFGMPRGAKRVRPSMNRNSLLLIHIQNLPPNMHKWKDMS